MKENTSMEAFLDDYGKIVVYLSQRFYNGKATGFIWSGRRGKRRRVRSGSWNHMRAIRGTR